MNLPDELAFRPPAVRGFWTDEELLQASGLTSVALLKKLQLANLTWPKHVPIPGGGRRRAWPLAEVARVQLAVKVADGTGVSVQAIAALLVSAGVPWVDRAANIKQRLEELTGGGGEADHGLSSPGTRIVLVGMEEAWREERAESFSIISSRMKLSGSDITVPAERAVRSPRRGRIAEWQEPVMTIIDLAEAGLRLSVFDQVRQDLRTVRMKFAPTLS